MAGKIAAENPRPAAQGRSKQPAIGLLGKRWSKYGDDLALRRMEKAGAIITTVDQIISELAIDWTSPNGNKLRGILDYH